MMTLIQMECTVDRDLEIQEEELYTKVPKNDISSQ